jgi:predicted nucleic acid-binding protein
LSFLVDTNVLSELRKAKRTNANVRVIGELRRGIANVARRDPAAATALDGWLRTVISHYADRILDVTVEVAQVCGTFNVPDPLPVVDSLLAATAHVHGLTVVTRNVVDIARTGVPVLDPFA